MWNDSIYSSSTTYWLSYTSQTNDYYFRTQILIFYQCTYVSFKLSKQTNRKTAWSKGCFVEYTPKKKCTYTVPYPSFCFYDFIFFFQLNVITNKFSRKGKPILTYKFIFHFFLFNWHEFCLIRLRCYHSSKYCHYHIYLVIFLKNNSFISTFSFPFYFSVVSFFHLFYSFNSW